MSKSKPERQSSEKIVYSQINKLYKQINEYYKTTNSEMVSQIVLLTDEIFDLYFDYVFSDMNDKDKHKVENALLTKRILNNESCNEASTFNTVLTFICGFYHFLYAYDNEPNKLFHHYNIYDWLHCAVHKFNMKKKIMFMFNDENIPETVERFLNINDDEIMKLIKINFDM